MNPDRRALLGGENMNIGSPIKKGERSFVRWCKYCTDRAGFDGGGGGW